MNDMPKVVLGTTKRLDDNYRNVLEHVLVDTPRDKLCKILDISERSLYKRKIKPENATLRELRILRRTGRVTDEQLLSIIREEDG